MLIDSQTAVASGMIVKNTPVEASVHGKGISGSNSISYLRSTPQFRSGFHDAWSQNFSVHVNLLPCAAKVKSTGPQSDRSTDRTATPDLSHIPSSHNLKAGQGKPAKSKLAESSTAKGSGVEFQGWESRIVSDSQISKQETLPARREEAFQEEGIASEPVKAAALPLYRKTLSGQFNTQSSPLEITGRSSQPKVPADSKLAPAIEDEKSADTFPSTAPSSPKAAVEATHAGSSQGALSQTSSSHLSFHSLQLNSKGTSLSSHSVPAADFAPAAQQAAIRTASFGERPHQTVEPATPKTDQGQIPELRGMASIKRSNSAAFQSRSDPSNSPQPHSEFLQVSPAWTDSNDTRSQISPVVPEDHDNSIPVATTFTAMDAPSSKVDPVWIRTTARSAEAGYKDPTLGWISLHARSDASGMHATLLPNSAEAIQTLSTHLPDLMTHIKERFSHVNEINIDSSLSGSSSETQSGANGEERENSPQPHSGHGNSVHQTSKESEASAQSNLHSEDLAPVRVDSAARSDAASRDGHFSVVV